jgi:hypothetical protein
LTHEIMVLQNWPDVKVSDWHPWNRRKRIRKKGIKHVFVRLRYS